MFFFSLSLIEVTIICFGPEAWTGSTTAIELYGHEHGAERDKPGKLGPVQPGV